MFALFAMSRFASGPTIEWACGRHARVIAAVAAMKWIVDRARSATRTMAVGVDVLTKLHDAWGAKPVTPDLDALWRDSACALPRRRHRVR